MADAARGAANCSSTHSAAQQSTIAASGTTENCFVPSKTARYTAATPSMVTTSVSTIKTAPAARSSFFKNRRNSRNAGTI